MPEWKAKSRIGMRLLDKVEKPEFHGSLLDDGHLTATADKTEFKLSDSVYFAGSYLTFELFGLHEPRFDFRIVRQVCTNGMVAKIVGIDHNFDFEKWGDLFSDWIKLLSVKSKVIPVTLDKMKTIEEDVLLTICNGRLTSKVPKRVLDKAPGYIEMARSGELEELPKDLIDTKFGTVNVLSAVARDMKSRSRFNVEATAMDYIFKEAA